MIMISEVGCIVVNNIPSSRPLTHPKMKSSSRCIENSAQSKKTIWIQAGNRATPLRCTPTHSPDNVDRLAYLPHFRRAKDEGKTGHEVIPKCLRSGDDFKYFSTIIFIHYVAKLCLKK